MSKIKSIPSEQITVISIDRSTLCDLAKQLFDKVLIVDQERYNNFKPTWKDNCSCGEHLYSVDAIAALNYLPDGHHLIMNNPELISDIDQIAELMEYEGADYFRLVTN